MSDFIDPRSNSDPGGGALPGRTTTTPEALKELQQLCRERRLYEVERWIQEGRPLQLADPRSVSRRHFSSALDTALAREPCPRFSPTLQRVLVWHRIADE